MIQEFKKFALRGNVMDLAVGVVIGGAFGRIVSSLVADMIMPLVVLLLGGRSVADLRIILEPATATTDEVALLYGQFFQTIIDFLIIVFSIFIVIRLFQSMRKKEEEKSAPPPEPSVEEVLLSEIRDLLKDQ